MKKFTVTVIALLLSLCALCACGSKSTLGSGAEKVSFVSAEQIDESVREFLGVDPAHADGNAGDRAPSSLSENRAAFALYERFADGERYPNLEVTPLNQKSDKSEDKTRFYIDYNGESRPSYNVEVRWRNPGNGVGKDFKQVIVGAGYGNMYGTPDAEDYTNGATGAFVSGTSAGTLSALADYCNAHSDELAAKCDFDLVFVFFGSTGYNSGGAVTYVNHLEPTESMGTLLMINIGQLGGDRVYLYAGDTATPQESFLRETASECGLEYFDLPLNMPIIDGMYLEDVYYTHFAMIGDHAPFAEKTIPSVSLISGYYGGFNLSDLERKGKTNLAGTRDDNYTNLKAYRPAYAEQGSDAVSLVLSSITREGFASAMVSARDEAKDYSFWTDPFWAYMIVIFALVALAVVLVVLVKYFEKKHPYVPPVRRMKVAVFGMDYEDKKDGDVFIDVKPRERNPFDGY